MALDADAALRATAKLGESLGTSADDTAGGVHEVVNQNMAAAARMHAIERGADMRGTPLIAFGGAGPVHACGVAELLDSPSIVFPANASVLSAFGALVTPVRIDLARSLVRRLDAISTAEREAVLEDMRNEGRAVLASAGVEPDSVTFRYAIDARYHGQGNEITIALGEGDSWSVSDAEVSERFATRYAAVYGMTIPGVSVEIVTWRVAAFAPAPAVSLAPTTSAGTVTTKGVRKVLFRRGAEPVATPVFDRASLPVGAAITGPALLEERETTTVLRPGWTAVVTDDGSVVAHREGA
jgi:N-methylhydantoinase A